MKYMPSLQPPGALEDVQLKVDQVLLDRRSSPVLVPTSRGASPSRLAATPSTETATVGTALGSGVMSLSGSETARGVTDSNGSALVPAAAISGPDTGSSVDSVQSGLNRWRQAVSNTTLTLMQRRMAGGSVQSVPGRRNSRSKLQQSGTPEPADSSGQLCAAPPRARMQAARPLNPAGQAGLGPAADDIQLHNIIGQGNFGCVYSGTWHGKRVAVKVMQLPANALLDDSPGALSQIRQHHNSSSHMAIMETVVSSTMSHPNVVQVYTYTLNPLTVDKGGGPGGGNGGTGGERQDLGNGSDLSGWELRLVMEYCDQVRRSFIVDSCQLSVASVFCTAQRRG
eukprot:GHUV01014888.1.p1 GENE.GHUV01014888.1~~GHUV01014888.1.p1  ORF type:complete len:340 (+),score=71.65 GHUV01014888.1:695-1714(+)